jgi:hypothetical protein
MSRLPTFPTATVDEVLDIRSELAPSLRRFRGAMVTVSKTFTSKPWQSDFLDEVHDAWVEKVHPAIEAIEESVREDHSLLAMAADYVRAANTSLPGLALVGAGLLGHADVAQALGGVFQAPRRCSRSFAIVAAHGNDVRMQPFYFLYRAEGALR